MKICLCEGSHEVVNHVETFLINVLDRHLIVPIKLLFWILDIIKTRVTFLIIVDTRGKLLNFELWCLEELIEVVTELPDIQDTFELLS